MQTVQRLLWSFMLPAWKIALSWAKRNTAVIHTRKGTNHRQDEGILLGERTFIQLKDEKLQTPQIIPPYVCGPPVQGTNTLYFCLKMLQMWDQSRAFDWSWDVPLQLISEITNNCWYQAISPDPQVCSNSSEWSKLKPKIRSVNADFNQRALKKTESQRQNLQCALVRPETKKWHIKI